MGECYELSGIDRVDVEGTPTRAADIANVNDILSAFEGIEAVVHLGADPSPQASWESVLSSNIVGTRNVYEAARLSGVKRIVFASSNHAVGNYPLRQDPYKAIYDGRLGEVRRPVRSSDDGFAAPGQLLRGEQSVRRVTGELFS